MADITYCINDSCPFKDCDRHLCKLEEAFESGQKYATISNFGGVCERYISYLVNEVTKEHNDEKE